MEVSKMQKKVCIKHFLSGLRDKMAEYKCFKCGKKISSEDLKKRFKCPHCDSKIFFKPRRKVKKIKAE